MRRPISPSIPEPSGVQCSKVPWSAHVCRNTHMTHIGRNTHMRHTYVGTHIRVQIRLAYVVKDWRFIARMSCVIYNYLSHGTHTFVTMCMQHGWVQTVQVPPEVAESWVGVLVVVCCVALRCVVLCCVVLCCVVLCCVVLCYLLNPYCLISLCLFQACMSIQSKVARSSVKCFLSCIRTRQFVY